MTTDKFSRRYGMSLELYAALELIAFHGELTARNFARFRCYRACNRLKMTKTDVATVHLRRWIKMGYLTQRIPPKKRKGDIVAPHYALSELGVSRLFFAESDADFQSFSNFNYRNQRGYRPSL